jgi:hypothetical protein
MREVEFRRLLDGYNALRIRFTLDQGKVEKFVVQLEARFNEHWVAIIRYDTAHSFAHCDMMHPYDSATKVRMATNDYNEALTFAMQDLTENWRLYRRRDGKWLQKK